MHAGGLLGRRLGVGVRVRIGTRSLSVAAGVLPRVSGRVPRRGVQRPQTHPSVRQPGQSVKPTPSPPGSGFRSTRDPPPQQFYCGLVEFLGMSGETCK